MAKPETRNHESSPFEDLTGDLSADEQAALEQSMPYGVLRVILGFFVAFLIVFFIVRAGEKRRTLEEAAHQARITLQEQALHAGRVAPTTLQRSLLYWVSTARQAETWRREGVDVEVLGRDLRRAYESLATAVLEMRGDRVLLSFGDEVALVSRLAEAQHFPWSETATLSSAVQSALEETLKEGTDYLVQISESGASAGELVQAANVAEDLVALASESSLRQDLRAIASDFRARAARLREARVEGGRHASAEEREALVASIRGALLAGGLMDFARIAGDESRVLEVGGEHPAARILSVFSTSDAIMSRLSEAGFTRVVAFGTDAEESIDVPRAPDTR